MRVMPDTPTATGAAPDWSPQQHADLAAMLDKLSRALLGEPADDHVISR
jgi:hypothetical protein